MNVPVYSCENEKHSHKKIPKDAMDQSERHGEAKNSGEGRRLGQGRGGKMVALALRRCRGERGCGQLQSQRLLMFREM